MKSKDVAVAIISTIIFSSFFLNDELHALYNIFNKEHAYIMAFIKFGVLATFGESIGKRIIVYQYLPESFGLLPRAIIWGFLGITIKLAFVIFATGVPNVLLSIGFTVDKISTGLTIESVIIAFSISLFMNVIYAPIMMTFHKITDTHITKSKGKLASLITPINFVDILKNLDWDKQWNFVFKKTIPFFWIPMHTITFLLPKDVQIIFAALLGVALGIILSIANKK